MALIVAVLASDKLNMLPTLGVSSKIGRCFEHCEHRSEWIFLTVVCLSGWVGLCDWSGHKRVDMQGRSLNSNHAVDEFQ